MKIVFRVDSSIQIGLGHLMRCLVLADELKKNGHNIFFICKDLEGNFISLINHPVIELRKDTKQKITLKNINNRKIIQEIDADETIKLIPLNTDIIVVDSYDFDEVWHKKLRIHTKKIVVIDDLADKNFDCDILINQNYGIGKKDYQNRLGKDCLLLLGLSYALLRPEFKKFRLDSIKKREGVKEIKNILITSGGSDMKNISLGLLKQLDKSYNIVVVLGLNSPHNNEVREFAKNRKNVKVLINPKNIAELMLDADLCIGSSGSTNWERLCMGLPSLVFTVAENQIKITRELDKEGLVKHIGFIETCNSIPIIQNEINSITNLTAWSEKCFKSSSCSGVEIIVDIIQDSLND